MGSSTENSAFGVVKNPIDKERVPGGSSGGSAAAIAANHCLGALGSDTGGSVRQPASFCGIVGFKPSYGMVSRYGLIAMASSLDQIGTFGKTVEDAKLIFDIIRGKDEMDATTIKSQKSKVKSQNLKIGIPKEYFGEGIDSKVKEVVEKNIKKFETIGAEIKEIDLSLTEYALPAYYIIMPAEVSANLARYDGVKYGYAARNKKQETRNNLLNHYLRTRAEGFGDEPRRRIILGTYVLSAGYRDAYYKKAQEVRALIKKELEQAFENVNLIMTPTAPSPAFKIGEKKNPLSMYLSDIYTTPASLAGLPAISVPCEQVNGLPIGLQIIGPQFYDDFVFDVAQIFGQLSQ
jgi:aspartyl-tRNA(Asn)/glutamyl-tRNA(Gln) amidotransferase subunit A